MMDAGYDVTASADRRNSFPGGMVPRRDSGGVDTPDIFVPLVLQPPMPRVSNGSQARQGGKESSDSRKWFGSSSPWKNGKSKVQEVISGPYTECAPEDNRYSMNYLSRGKCVILNHTSFDPVQQLTKREGSDVDVKNIQLTFKKFGFTVVTYEDLKYDEIIYNLEAIANEDHTHRDCLVVFVLTHGQNNQLHAYDTIYKPSSLWSMFTGSRCSTLAGKPKMFFIQACRGDQFDNGTELKIIRARTQVDGPGDDTYRIPDQADFLTVYSTAEGYFAWRNSKNGSVFVQTLCKVFQEYSDKKDVLAMMTLVNRNVAICYESRSKDPAQNMKKQIPHVCHTLTREIYLSPKYQSTLV